MSVTAVETVALMSGDTVRVSVDAEDRSGNAALDARGKQATLDYLDGYSGWFVRPIDGSYGTFVAAEYLTKVTEADTLREQVDVLTAKLAEMTRAAEALREAPRAELSAFQAKVEQAISGAADDDDGDSDNLLNGVLESLGLDLLTREYEITVRFNGSYSVTVNATSEDNATEQVDKDDVVEYLTDSGSLSYAIDDVSAEIA